MTRGAYHECEWWSLVFYNVVYILARGLTLNQWRLNMAKAKKKAAKKKVAKKAAKKK